ncbi:MAG: bacteriohemerythrin [Acidobacteriota bacterium]
MASVQWSDTLSVNIQEIDLQHRQLIELVAELEKALADGVDKEIMGRVIRELNTYVREHFSTEERWMARYEFPGLKAHAAQHEQFVETLLHFELDYLADRKELSSELLAFLMNWLKEHILGFDQHYARYFQEKGYI